MSRELREALENLRPWKFNGRKREYLKRDDVLAACEAALAAFSQPQFIEWAHDQARRFANTFGLDDKGRWAVEQLLNDAAAALRDAGEAPPILDLDLFRAQLIDGQIIKESDGEPWPLTESEANQICSALRQRLDKVWPVRAVGSGQAGAPLITTEMVKEAERMAMTRDGVSPEGIAFALNKLLAPGAALGSGRVK